MQGASLAVRRLFVVLGCTATTTAACAQGADGTALFEKAFAQRRKTTVQNIALPTVLDGREIGVVPAQIRGAGIAVSRRELSRLLEGILLPGLHQQLNPPKADEWVTPDELARLGVEARYVPQTITLQLQLTLASRQVRRHRIDSRAGADDGPAAADAPEAVSPSPWSVIANSRWTFARAQAPGSALDTGRVQLEGAARLGGWVTEASGSLPLNAGSGQRVRDWTRLSRDWPAQATRLTLGDATTTARPGLPAVALGGLQLGRRYSLNPAMGTLSQPGDRLVLPQGGAVDVIVNGAVARTLHLGPGVHELRDIPVFTGANQVELRVVEPGGKVQTRSFDYFFDTSLLAPGLLEYELAAGHPAQSQANGTGYRHDEPLASASARLGLRADWTAGAALQWRGSRAGAVRVGALESAWASPWGTLALAATANRHPTFSGHSTSVQWRWQSAARPAGAGERWSGSALAQFTHRSSGHASVMGDLPGSAAREWGLRLGAIAPGGTGFSASLARATGALPGDNSHSAAFSARRRLDRHWSLEASIQRQQRADGAQTALGLSLRYSGERQPDGSGQRASALVNSQEQRRQIEGEAFGVASWAAADAPWRVAVGRADSRTATETRLSAQARTSRGDWTAQWTESRTDAGATAFSDLSFAAALVADPGGWTLTPPVADSAAIISPLKPYAGLRIHVDPIGDRSAATSDRWGPPVLTDLNAYTARDIQLDVADLPPGMGLGVDRPRLQPAYRSVLRVPLGSDANVQLAGQVLRADGKPAALVALQLLPERGGAAVDVFTSRRGQFTSPPLRPGRYRIVAAGELQVLGSAEIAAEETGIRALGTLHLQTENR